MSEDQAVPVGTEAALGDLEGAVRLLAANKGKQKGLKDALRRQWSQSVATVFSDAGCQLEPVLQSLVSLPPLVAALGAVRAWPSMSEDRRNVYLRWLDTLDSERAGSQKAVLIPELLESSPATSVELLCNVSLANQELKHRLASSLLGESIGKCRLLLMPDAPEYKVRKVVMCLLQLSETTKVPAEVRRDTVRLALGTLVNQKLHHGSLATPLLNLISANISNLPPIFKQELDALLAEMDVDLNSNSSARRPAPPAAAQAHVGAVLADTPTPAASAEARQEPLAKQEAPSAVGQAERVPASGAQRGSVPERPSDMRETEVQRRVGLLAHLDDWLTALRGRTKLLEELQQHIEALEARQADLEGAVRAAGAREQAALSAEAKSTEVAAAAAERVRSVEQRLQEATDAARQAQERAASLEERLSSAVERESAAGDRLRVQEDQAARERAELQQRIQTNADRRLEEFRTALASSLARLFHGLPRRGASVSGELGEVILTRLHEVIAFFESKGIRVNFGEGDQR
jgi:hypothetical protein